MRKIFYGLLATVLAAGILHAQSTQGPVVYQNFAPPSGACSLPNFLTVTTVGSGAGVYQCFGSPPTWQQLGTGAATSITGLVTQGTNITITGSGTILSPYVISASGTVGTAFSAITSATNTAASMLVGTGASLGPTGSGSIAATTLEGGTTNDLIYQPAANTTGFLSPVNNAVLVTSAGGVPSESTTLPSGLTIPGYAPLASPTFTGVVTIPTGGVLGTPTSINISNATGLTSSQVTTALTYTPANCTAGTTGSDCLILTGGLVPVANIPLATTGAFGAVKPDGSTITISGGVISAVGGGSSAFSSITNGTNTTATMTVGSGGTLTYSGSGVVNATELLGATWASPAAIGGTTPAAIAATTISATGGITSGPDGTHAGIFGIYGNTANPSIPANEWGWLGPDVATFTSLFFQPTTTAPTAGQVMAFGVPSGNVSQQTWITPQINLSLVAGTYADTDICTYTASGTLLNCNLASTGTGNVVFSNSPTLVTPALGTPSAAVLTNATGLPTAGLVNNAVTSAKLAVVNTYRTCDIPINDTSGSAITSGQMGPQSRVCFIPAASTIVEMDVNADAGTPNIIVGRNHAGTIANIVSGALATAASGGIACSNTGGTTGINGATTCSGTLQNTSLSAGDYLELVSGTPDGTAKFFVVHVVYTVN